MIKRYAGPDAVLRREAEVKALTTLAGRFPVPTVIGQDDSQLTLSFVPGAPGQEILEQRPHDVLFAVGRAGRALHGLDVSATYEIVGGAVLVHGDFGPQNMVFDAKTLQPAAVVDWEFAHPGDAVRIWRGLSGCRWSLDFVRRWPGADAASVAMWQRRVEVTTDFRE